MNFNRHWYNRFLANSNKKKVMSIYLTQMIEHWIAKKIFRSRFVDSISIDLSEQCNLSCAYCYKPEVLGKREISPSLFNKIIKDNAETKQFDLIGGEPFSNPEHLFRLIKSNRDRFFFIYTNGSLLTDTILSSLSTFSNLMLMVSFDGWRSTKKRRNISEAKQRRLFERLKGSDVCYGVSINIYPENFSEVVNIDLVEELLSLGCVAFKYGTIVGNREYRLSLDCVTKFHNWFLDTKKRYFGLWSTPCFNASDGCCSGIRTVHFDVEGNLYPCPHIPFSMDNILYTDMTRAINSNYFQQVRRLSSSIKNPYLKCLPQSVPEKIDQILSDIKKERTDEFAYT